MQHKHWTRKKCLLFCSCKMKKASSSEWETETGRKSGWEREKEEWGEYRRKKWKLASKNKWFENAMGIEKRLLGQSEWNEVYSLLATLARFASRCRLIFLVFLLNEKSKQTFAPECIAAISLSGKTTTRRIHHPQQLPCAPSHKIWLALSFGGANADVTFKSYIIPCDRTYFSPLNVFLLLLTFGPRARALLPTKPLPSHFQCAKRIWCQSICCCCCCCCCRCHINVFFHYFFFFFFQACSQTLLKHCTYFVSLIKLRVHGAATPQPNANRLLPVTTCHFWSCASLLLLQILAARRQCTRHQTKYSSLSLSNLVYLFASHCIFEPNHSKCMLIYCLFAFYRFSFLPPMKRTPSNRMRSKRDRRASLRSARYLKVTWIICWYLLCFTTKYAFFRTTWNILQW